MAQNRLRSAGQMHIDLRLLILLPVLTYAASYVYLALYHGKVIILSTPVHESGRYTLVQDMLYASHFLGHIPVLTVLALLFVGAYLCFTTTGSSPYQWKMIAALLALLLVFLLSAFILGLAVFGQEDTFAFLAQRKQGVGIYAEGGSWNLHLPSTMLLFCLVPVYVYIAKMVFGRSIHPNASGLFPTSLGLILFLLFTALLNPNIVDSVTSIWRDPRYLAHSVRELLTFPVTYFPIPLYLFLKREVRVKAPGKREHHRNVEYLVACLAIIVTLAVFYQSYISLTAGIGDIAQKPDFARGGRLGIPYLLASHYFEHFLDTIYFTLLCVLMYSFALSVAKPFGGTR